ncbi:MAG: arsenate reductase ArsC [Candidatus Omnitrophica bacterium]|nr:arsenate reductase ArsC [Candidatus Omnitrophota bacterium]
MNKIKVLFVCVHNSARSQIAEAYLNNLAGEHFEAESAGLEPGALNPLVVRSMAAEGIDISSKKTKSVQGMIDKGIQYDYAVTVCDEASAEKCPLFPGGAKHVHWGFDDPSQFTGSEEEKLEKIKIVRDEIKNRIDRWIEEVG